MQSKPPCLIASEWQLWKNIQQTAASLVLKIKDNRPQTNVPRPKPDTVIPPLDLPFPSDILAPISSYGLPKAIHQRITNCLVKRICELQQGYQTRYRQACLSMPVGASFDHDTENYRKVFQSLYLRHGLPIVHNLVESIRSAADKALRSSETRRTFNHERTPFLEVYFELNAYPSSAHRLALATDSGMTKRQIEVWFQNHRSRAKKEGKLLRRLGSEYPLLRARELWVQYSRSSSPFECTHPSPESEISEPEDEQPPLLLPGFSTVRPPHAFPVKYPADLGFDPFPSNKGIFEFPPPAWPRRPDHIPRQRSDFVDMDEFVALFATKLSIRDGAHKAKTVRQTLRKQPWSSHVTVPYPAPHPAFLSVSRNRSSRKPQDLSLSRCNLVIPRFAQVSLPSSSSAPNHARKAQKPPPFSKSLPSNLSPLSPTPSPTTCHGSRTSSFGSISSLSSMEVQTPVSPWLSSELVPEASWLIDNIFELDSDQFTFSIPDAKTENQATFSHVYPSHFVF